MGEVGNACAIVTGHSRGLGAALVDSLLGQGLPVLALAALRAAEAAGLTAARPLSPQVRELRAGRICG